MLYRQKKKASTDRFLADMDRALATADYNIRVALIGPKNAGKSTLVAAFVDPKTIGTTQKVTISTDVTFAVISKIVDQVTQKATNRATKDSVMRSVRIIFTDTAGIDRMNKATEMIMRSTNVVILCYDIADMYSLMKIAFSTGHGTASATRNGSTTNPTQIGPKSSTSKPSPDQRARFILVGCKADKRSEAIIKFADDMLEIHPNMIHLWTTSRESLLNGTIAYASNEHVDVTKILCGDPLNALNFIETNSVVEDDSGKQVVIPYVFSDYVRKMLSTGDASIKAAIDAMETRFWSDVLTKENETRGQLYYSKFPVFDGMAQSFARYVTTCSLCEYDNMIIDETYETAAAKNRNVFDLFTERIFTDVPLTLTDQGQLSNIKISSPLTHGSIKASTEPRQRKRWRCDIL